MITRSKTLGLLLRPNIMPDPGVLTRDAVVPPSAVLLRVIEAQ